MIRFRPCQISLLVIENAQVIQCVLQVSTAGKMLLFFVQNLEIELFSLLQPALILVQDSEVGGGEDCLNSIRREKLGYCPRAQEMISALSKSPRFNAMTARD